VLMLGAQDVAFEDRSRCQTPAEKANASATEA
jgi:hypothetical protein